MRGSSVEKFDWEKMLTAYRQSELNRLPGWNQQGRSLIMTIFRGMRLGGIYQARWEKDVKAVTLQVVCEDLGVRQWARSLGMTMGCFVNSFCPLKDMVWEIEFVVEDDE